MRALDLRIHTNLRRTRSCSDRVERRRGMDYRLKPRQ
jgi:hypothetical protein